MTCYTPGAETPALYCWLCPGSPPLQQFVTKTGANQGKMHFRCDGIKPSSGEQHGFVCFAHDVASDGTWNKAKDGWKPMFGLAPRTAQAPQQQYSNGYTGGAQQGQFAVLKGEIAELRGRIEKLEKNTDGQTLLQPPAFSAAQPPVQAMY